MRAKAMDSFRQTVSIIRELGCNRVNCGSNCCFPVGFVYQLKEINRVFHEILGLTRIGGLRSGIAVSLAPYDLGSRILVDLMNTEKLTAAIRSR